MQPTITITPSAVNYIKKMIAKAHGKGFRMSIKKTGCSGFTYAPAVVDKVNPNDVALTVSDIEVYLDTAWLDLLETLQVDYQEEDKSGLKQKRLIFVNPKETSRCGCGESFHTDE